MGVIVGYLEGYQICKKLGLMCVGSDMSTYKVIDTPPGGGHDVIESHDLLWDISGTLILVLTPIVLRSCQMIKSHIYLPLLPGIDVLTVL